MYRVREVECGEWEKHLRNCQSINMLQCGQYGLAKEQVENWRAVRLLIENDAGVAIALCQWLVKGLPLLGGVARMNRGPVLMGDVDSQLRERLMLDIINVLLIEARRRRWWLIQIAPELYESDSAVKRLRELNLKQLDVAPSASGLFSLAEDEETLMKRLKGKWRNCLRKGLRSAVTIKECVGNSPELSALLKRYEDMKEDKGFSGVSNELIFSLANQMGEQWQFTLLIAHEGDGGTSVSNDSIGMLVSVRHGDTATYFIGSTNERGRKLQANYVLLWHAILHAKKLGCKWFDIGGLNKTTPEGIAHFKQGVNATPYSLIGEWRKIILPWTSIAKPKESMANNIQPLANQG